MSRDDASDASGGGEPYLEWTGCEEGGDLRDWKVKPHTL